MQERHGPRRNLKLRLGSQSTSIADNQTGGLFSAKKIINMAKTTKTQKSQATCPVGTCCISWKVLGGTTAWTRLGSRQHVSASTSSSMLEPSSGVAFVLSVSTHGTALTQNGSRIVDKKNCSQKCCNRQTKPLFDMESKWLEENYHSYKGYKAHQHDTNLQLPKRTQAFKKPGFLRFLLMLPVPWPWRESWLRYSFDRSSIYENLDSKRGLPQGNL